jgi:hypothetical protein
MNPRQFLILGGAALLLVGILGFVGVIGPTAEDSIFGDPWFFDNGENYAHTVLGIVGLAAAFLFPVNLQRILVLALGILGIFVGVFSLFGPITEGVTFLGSNLQNPADTILHLVIGAWALLAGYRRPAPMMR